MSENPQSSPSVLPALLIVAVIAVLVVWLTPRLPARAAVASAPVNDTAQTEAQEVSAPAAEVDKSAQDFMTLLMLGQAQVPASSVRTGQRLFGSTCASCHGYDAKGLAGNGKTLVNSAFVNNLSDRDLIQFITVGRTTSDPLNTTGVNMPGKGGNLSLTEDDLQHIVNYIRGLNGATIIQDVVAEATPIERREFKPINLSGLSGSGDSSASASMPTPEPTATPTPSPEPQAATASASSADSETLKVGEAAYLQSCVSCHGADLRGVSYMPYTDISNWAVDGDKLTKMLTQIGFMVNGYIHPFRGGFPELSDAQIEALIAYLQAR